MFQRQKVSILLFLFSLALGLFTPSAANGSDDILEKVHRLNWDGLEVVWLESDRLPLYSVNIYFADGALSDEKKHYGETELMFDLLDEGTRRYSSEEISENLEFFGASYGSRVTHEYSSFSVSGMMKDIGPTMKMICHLFSDASYPRDRVAEALKRKITHLKNSIRSHGWLASRVFRELSLQGTPYHYPVGGKLKDLRHVASSELEKKLSYFRDEVKKRIYISGPKDVLELKKVFLNECKWGKENADFVRSASYSKEELKDGPKTYLVTVPNANQAQVRIGRFLNQKEIQNEYAMMLASHYLGGGFTSRLMREVRVKAGLTYSVSAVAAAQKDYGRAFISTFTPNPKIAKLVEVIQRTVTNSTDGDLNQKALERSRGNLIGSYPFQFQKPDQFLSEIMLLDHKNKSLRHLVEFKERIDDVSAKEVRNELKKLFSFGHQTIVILGSEGLAKYLDKADISYEKKSYKEFL